MPYTVYGLSDPRTPHILRYVGRTSVHHKKRTSDHIAAARFHDTEKHTPVMRWLAELDAEGIRAISTPIGIYSSDAHAEQVESTLIETFKDTLLNSPVGHTRGGRPPGTTDSPGAIRRKKEAWQRTNVSRRSEATTEAYTRIRAEQGYPYPHLHTRHPLNEDHNRRLRGLPLRSEGWSETRSNGQKRYANEKYGEWRVAMGFPNPNASVQHPDNAEWAKTAKIVPYAQWKQEKDLAEAARLLVPPGKELN